MRILTSTYGMKLTRDDSSLHGLSHPTLSLLLFSVINGAKVGTHPLKMKNGYVLLGELWPSRSRGLGVRCLPGFESPRGQHFVQP